MNKQDIKISLDKIRPSEKLIEDTIRKANEIRYNENKKRSAFTFEAFNFKLAGAVCAFAIILTLGIFAGSNGFFTEEKNPPIEEVNFRHAEQITDVAKKRAMPSNAALVMVEDAKNENSAWAVIEGVVSGCYPSSSNENKTHYLVQIDDVNLYELGSDTSSPSDFENGLVAAFDTEAEAEKFNDLLNLMSSPIYIRLEKDNTNEGTDWKIVDFSPQE